MAHTQPDLKAYKLKHAVAKILDMRAAQTPRWIRRVAGIGFAALLILIAGIAAALRSGAADERAWGAPVWQTEFAPDRASDWQIIVEAGATADFSGGGLVLALPNADAHALLLRTGAAGAWMLAADAMQTGGAPGAMHGIAFNCVSETACSYVLLNNNGYVQVFREEGSERTVWFELQQWPHVRRGAAANRVQLAGNTESVEVRVNDELLLRVPARPGTMAGVAARASVPDQQVTFTFAEYRRSLAAASSHAAGAGGSQVWCFAGRHQCLETLASSIAAEVTCSPRLRNSSAALMRSRSSRFWLSFHLPISLVISISIPTMAFNI